MVQKRARVCIAKHIIVAAILLGAAPVAAGDVRSGPGLVSGKGNAAAAAGAAGEMVLDHHKTAMEIMRVALAMPLKSATTVAASKVTSFVGTISFFALDAASDEDALSGVQTVTEIYREDSVSGIKAGSAGHYARSAGFSNEEFAELVGW